VLIVKLLCVSVYCLLAYIAIAFPFLLIIDSVSQCVSVLLGRASLTILATPRMPLLAVRSTMVNTGVSQRYRIEKYERFVSFYDDTIRYDARCLRAPKS